MKVETRRQGSVTVVIPRGAVTSSDLGPLRSALDALDPDARGRLVLDLSGVPFVDSAGIEYLLSVAAASPSAALRPRLAGIGDTVREALDLTNTLKRFLRFDTVDSAVRSYL